MLPGNNFIAMQFFVEEGSIVRKIWGSSDTILLIFAGGAAEFALNKAVDWLYYTGKLPSDPIGRLFSTVSYAQKIVFAPLEEAHTAIDTITQIHSALEQSRGASIPDWAYRDVLFMLIHYSIAAHELFHQNLSPEEKEEVYQVFYRLGHRMGLKELPVSYEKWLPVRKTHLRKDLAMSDYSKDLFVQYKKHLGSMRYTLLLEGQKLVVPPRVRNLLGLKKFALLRLFIPIYKLSRLIKLDGLFRLILLPGEYRQQIKDLNMDAG